jgi:hypothetical protein
MPTTNSSRLRVTHRTGLCLEVIGDVLMPGKAITSVAPIVAMGVTGVVGVVLLGCRGGDDSQVGSSSKATQGCLDWSADQFQNAQAKITYAGEQTLPVLTVVFHTKGHELSMKQFLCVQHESDVLYGNDAGPDLGVFTVANVEFREMVRSVKPFLNDAILKVDEKGKRENILLFTITSENDGRVEGGEFGVAQKAANGFYKTLLNAVHPQNHAGRRILMDQAIAANVDSP